MDPLQPVLKELAGSRAITVLEIGTRRGESLRYVAFNFPVKRYIAIDPFKNYEEYSGDEFNDVLWGSEDQIYRQTLALGQELLGHRFSLIRAFSAEAAVQIDDGSVDFVFIDGNHRFDFVMEDLRSYWPKVSQGGYLCGHDYFMRSRALGGGFDEPMVYEAVTAFSNEFDLRVISFGEHRGFPMCFAMKKLEQ